MHPIAPFARVAYAAGLARSGAPVNARTKSGCVAAVAMACEHADDPRILEATLQLGSLEGVWATVFDRRDALAAEHTRLVTAAWRKALTRKAIAQTVRGFRRRAGLAESDSGQDPDEIRARANDAATELLAALPQAAAWAAVRQALRDAIAAGRAEGVVGAVTLAADAAGRLGLDWDIAFDHAYAALADLDELWDAADGWLGRMLDGAASDLGRALAASAESGASYEDMLAAAVDVLAGTDVASVAFITDWALNTALSQGALDLYRSEGVAWVDFMTAGDGRVCPQCLDAEDNSPYPIGDLPTPPLHGRCRCAVSASLTVPSAFDDFFAAA